VEVTEGIDTVEGLRVGNAYLVRGADGLLVVDSGIPGSAKRILASIERTGARPSDLRHIVLTHWHPDHMGSAAELRQLTGARIAIHELDAPVLAGRERPAKGRRTMGLLLGSSGSPPWSPMSPSGPATSSAASRSSTSRATRRAASPCAGRTASCSPAMRCSATGRAGCDHRTPGSVSILNRRRRLQPRFARSRHRCCCPGTELRSGDSPGGASGDPWRPAAQIRHQGWSSVTLGGWPAGARGWGSAR
jgi:hypothetical protein